VRPARSRDRVVAADAEAAADAEEAAEAQREQAGVARLASVPRSRQNSGSLLTLRPEPAL